MNASMKLTFPPDRQKYTLIRSNLRSDVQRYASGPGYYQTLVVYGQNIIDVFMREMNRYANCFLPVESKDYKFCFI